MAAWIAAHGASARHSINAYTIAGVNTRMRAPTRVEPREIVELRELKVRHPELAPAVDMQIEIVDMQRRVQARVPLPRLSPDRARLATVLKAGRALIRFSDLPIEWSDLRLTIRQAADILRRHDIIDVSDHQAIERLTRDGQALEPSVTRWYQVTARLDETVPREQALAGAPASLEQVFLLALRPFLVSSPQTLADAVDLSSWRAGYCPYCGWEPEFAVVAIGGDRLVCGRCAAEWPAAPSTCPFCRTSDRGHLVSFATPDGRYRVSACNRCKRYLKAYDRKVGGRPLLLAYDTIATLPLDAAAQQQGYSG
jgi:hypothetical protein